MILFYKISSSLLKNRKEPELQIVISAPAPGGNLISDPRLRNTACVPYKILSEAGEPERQPYAKVDYTSQ